MPVTILQLGSPRHPGEGLRIGTVRRPPRGVPKSQFSKLNYYDVWLPVLSPSQDLVAFALASRDARSWQTFERKFRAEMKQPDPSRTLDLLAALSHQTSFSIGCYCDDETRCHRSVLRKLLAERRADIVRSSRPKIPARTPPGNRVHEEARDRFLSKQEERHKPCERSLALQRAGSVQSTPSTTHAVFPAEPVSNGCLSLRTDQLRSSLFASQCR